MIFFLNMFKEKLKETRKQKGLKQKEIAKMLNVVESCYANWEQGRTEPNIETIKKLCYILNTTPNELLEYENKTEI